MMYMMGIMVLVTDMVVMMSKWIGIVNLHASYIKLKKQELKDFNSKETFSKKEPVTEWEKINTLDC